MQSQNVWFSLDKRHTLIKPTLPDGVPLSRM